jgi:hypothetical protein
MKTRTTLLPLLSVLAAAPALAQPTVEAGPTAPRVPFTFSLDSQVQWHLDRSYRLFGTDRSDVDVGLTAAVEVDGWPRAPGRGDRHPRQQPHRRLRGDQRGQARAGHPSAVGAMRWPVGRWFEPQVRVAADLTWAKLRLTTTARAGAEDRVWSPAAAPARVPAAHTGHHHRAARGVAGAGGGVDRRGRPARGRAAVVRRGATGAADEKLANDRIPAASVPVGDLGRVEPYLRISLALSI